MSPEKKSIGIDRLENTDWNCDKILEGGNKEQIFCCPHGSESLANTCVGSTKAVILSSGEDDRPSIHISKGLKGTCGGWVHDSTFWKSLSTNQSIPIGGKTCSIPFDGDEWDNVKLV